MKDGKAFRTGNVDDCTYGEFVVLFAACEEQCKRDLIKRYEHAARPSRLCGKEVPENLHVISYGCLEDLRNADESKDPIAESARILLGITLDDLLKENVVSVLGFKNFVASELKTINDAFKAIKIRHTSEEVAAGIDQLNFGPFGVLDWYAKRMGMTNQNDVREVAWVRIYNCMKMDNEQMMYERRLHDEYVKRAKTK